MRYRHYKEEYESIKVEGCDKKKSGSFKLVSSEWTDDNGWPHDALYAVLSRARWFNCKEFRKIGESEENELQNSIVNMLYESGEIESIVWLPTRRGWQLPLDGSVCTTCRFYGPNRKEG